MNKPEDERHSGKIPSRHAIGHGEVRFSVFDELRKVFAFVIKISGERLEVVIFVEHVKLLVMFIYNATHVGVNVWENVQNVRRRIVQVRNLN